MTLSPEVRAHIRRLFHAEHWKIGTIASELGIHHDAVRSALEAHRFVSTRKVARSTLLDPYKPFIGETLEQHPRLRSSRIFEMIRGRGYTGSVVALRRYVRGVRPVPTREAFFRLDTLPGEQAQVDWGHFGRVRVGRAERRLSCFVMVLSFSRAIYARFSLDQTMENFLRGHVAAFEAFGGAPRTIFYDNLKSVVLERVGEHVRFHPSVLELAGHYHFAPQPCAPYRPNEKGKVERAIQYIRTSFFEARSFNTVSELNIEIVSWIASIADMRPWPGDPERKLRVFEARERERSQLLRRPEHDFPASTMRTVRSGKTPYVRFDLNDYSIPIDFVGKSLTLLADELDVRLIHGADEVIAKHKRSWSRGERIEIAQHLDTLAAEKRRARENRGRDRLRSVCPSTDRFLSMIVSRGNPVRPHTAHLNRLLDRFGAPALETAINAALTKNAASSASVAHILDQENRRHGLLPPLETVLPDDPRVRDTRVTQHDLGSYAALLAPSEEEP